MSRKGQDLESGRVGETVRPETKPSEDIISVSSESGSRCGQLNTPLNRSVQGQTRIRNSHFNVEFEEDYLNLDFDYES